jgi:hypothetical protein
MKSETDLKSELAKAISISMAKPKIRARRKNIFPSLKKEMNVYEARRALTSNLKMLLDSLLTIRPTSAQNERIFFYFWNICHETKPRLSDMAINALCASKFYYKNVTF